MRIAVTYENGQIFQHFGKTEHFKIYDVENGEVVKSEVVGTEGQGHGQLPGFLKQNGVQMVICGGLGGPMVSALANAGIELYAGNAGNADEAVKAYIDGTLAQSTDANCDCHGDH